MAVHGTERAGPDATKLAQRPTIEIGPLRIEPATRRIAGPAGDAFVQPRIMHLLLALVDAGGTVVARDELERHGWGDRFVAEDSLNGAIAEIRKALRTAGATGVNVVTVPKTGYRLDYPDAPAQSGDRQATGPAIDRRWFIAGGAVTLAAGGGLVWRGIGGTDRAPTARMLIEQGTIALRQGLPDHDAQGVAAFRRAVALEPDSAKGWGMLALAQRAAAEYAAPDQVAPARRQAELAARRALSIDPRQSDALTALALLTPSFGQWGEAERRLRGVLAVDRANPFAVAGLGTLLMSTGQVRACLRRLDWLDARDPLSPNLQFRRVYTLWSVGRVADMDAAADRALQSWPRHPAVWFARLWTLAFTGRADRARAMLADSATRPAMPPPAAELLGLSLAALARPSAALASQAVAANITAAARGPGQAISAIMVLSRLGAAREAYDVARGFLLHGGPVMVRQRHSAAQPSVTDQHHRMTMMLWIPATEALRLEPRFRDLCDAMGMVRYWRATGTRPDFDRGSLAVI
jgi:DNA-binding winged helix-turn-helix (wHTH) protein